MVHELPRVRLPSEVRRLRGWLPFITGEHGGEKGIETRRKLEFSSVLAAAACMMREVERRGGAFLKVV